MERNANFNEKRKECILYSIFSIILLSIILFRLYNLKGIQHAYDESGYWTAAAYFLGFDWSDLTEFNLYYSYGYGMLLAVLMKILPFKYLYQGAIVINGILLVVEFYLINYCIKKLCSDLKIEIRILMSFAIIVYPYNMFYAHLTVSEVFLVFLYILSIAVFIKMMESSNWILRVCFAMIIGFMYMVHQRCIGITLAAIMAIIVMTILKKEKTLNLIIFICTLGVILILAEAIKNGYVNAWFNSNLQGASLNDYSGQASKVSKLFSVQGIISFIYSIIGKWFGICCSTIMLVSLGVWGILKDTYVEIRKCKSKTVSRETYIKIYCLLCFFACFGINCIFFIEPKKYADYLIYTRYTETAVLPIIFYGIYRLIIRNVSIREVIINIIILVFSVCVVINRAGILGLTSYVGQGNIAIWDLYNDGMNVSTFMGSALIRTLILFIFFFTMSIIKWKKEVILVIMSVFWLSVSVNAYQKDYNTRKTNDISNIAKIIDNNTDKIKPLYYYIGQEKNATVTAFYLQLMDADRKITILKSWKDVENIPNGSYILTNGVSDIALKEKNNYIILDKSWCYALIEKNVKK